MSRPLEQPLTLLFAQVLIPLCLLNVSFLFRRILLLYNGRTSSAGRPTWQPFCKQSGHSDMEVASFPGVHSSREPSRLPPFLLCSLQPSSRVQTLGHKELEVPELFRPKAFSCRGGWLRKVCPYHRHNLCLKIQNWAFPPNLSSLLLVLKQNSRHAGH